jgi:hypothetical protein
MLTLFIVVGLGSDPVPSVPTLSGVVRDDAGRPLPKATVFIRTAAPRQGVGVL